MATPSDPPAPVLASAARTRDQLDASYPFASHWQRQPEGWMHYVDEGPADGPHGPLLCVHGNPTWSYYFRRVVSGLSDRRRVLAVDHLGCGLSEKPQDWSYQLEGHVDNLERLVLELDLKDITLVLHDWGGAIGMGLAVRQPDRIGRIILGNTSAFHIPRIPLRIAVCRWPLFGPLALRGFAAFSRAAVHMAVERKLEPAHARGLLAPYGSWHDRIAQLRFVQDIPMKPSHPTWDTLAGIEAGLTLLKDKPMSIHWGMRDWCFTPHFLEGWIERFPGAEVHRHADSGHYLLEDAHAELLPSYTEFLDRVEATS